MMRNGNTLMDNSLRYLAVACSFAAAFSLSGTTIFKGAALPLWFVGYACAVAAALLAARAQAARPGTRAAWLLGALGVIALGGIIGFAVGALLRGGG